MRCRDTWLSRVSDSSFRVFEFMVQALGMSETAEISGCWKRLYVGCTLRLHSISFLGFPYHKDGILNTKHKKELLWSLWVVSG